MNEQLYGNHDVLIQIIASSTLCDGHRQQLGVDLTVSSHSLLKLLACRNGLRSTRERPIHSPEHLHPSHPQPPVSSDSWLPLWSFRSIAGASLIRNTTSLSFNECVPRCSQTPEIPSSSLPEHRISSLHSVHAHTCCAQLLEKSGSPSPQRDLLTTSV